MKARTLQRIVSANTTEVAPGIFVRRPLPAKGLRQRSPFLLLDHMGPENIAAGYNTKIPAHPHRGFMPVTLLLSGQIQHRDSTGNQVTLNPGDVGWMIAGKGIIHEERIINPSLMAPGCFHAVQLWINLPAKDKLMAPAYETFLSANIPVWQREGLQLRIIAGQYAEHTGPAPVYSPTLLAHGLMHKNTRAFLPLPPAMEAAIYVLGGSVLEAGNHILEEAELCLWNTEGTGIQLSCQEECQFLLLAGEPIHEPLATYGTFVMNRPEELIQAVDDYKAGRMGTL